MGFLFVSFILLIAVSVRGEVSKTVEGVEAAMGRCSCSIEPASREADDKVIGDMTLKDVNGRDFKVSVANDVFTLALFQELTVEKKIPFGFPEDGCYARAHEMARLLTKKGIATGKVFATGVFRVASGKAPKGAVSWQFHVAPFLIVDSGKKRGIWVLDPSLFYEPASLDSWLKELASHPSSKLDSVFLTNRYIYHPSHRARKLDKFDDRDLKKSAQLMKRYLKRQSSREEKAKSDL